MAHQIDNSTITIIIFAATLLFTRLLLLHILASICCLYSTATGITNFCGVDLLNLNFLLLYAFFIYFNFYEFS